MDSAGVAALRGVCSEYFESHVSPILRYIQQSQEQLNVQLQEIRRRVELKANKDEVPTLEDVAARGWQAGGASVTTQVRLKELAALVQRKADIGGVATLAQLNKLAAAVEQKASAKETVTVAQAAQLLTALERKANADGVPSLAQFRELAEVVERKANAADAAAPEQLRALRAELLELRASGPSTGPARAGAAAEAEPSPEVRRVQVVVAAAGARFERQLRELRQQLRELRAEQQGEPREEGGDARWPGRRLGGAAPAALSDAASVAAESDAASFAGSLASCSGSLAGFGAEERTELRRIQAVVGAAGTTFSRELREVRSQLRALQAELQRMREAPGDGAPGGSPGPSDSRGLASKGR